MKLTVQRQSLLAAFARAAMFVPSRSPRPILQHVKLSAKKAVTLSATDGEVGITLSVAGCEVSEAGACLLPAIRMLSILKELTDEQLVIEADSEGIAIRGERSQWKLAAAHPDDFPEVAAFDADHYHDVDAATLRELLRRTLFACDVSVSRYALGGVLLEFGERQLTAVATDGRRIAKMHCVAEAVNGGATSATQTIVPERAAKLIGQVLGDADGRAKLAASINAVHVQADGAAIYARLVEGRFPKWRDAIPSRTVSTKIDLSAGPLAAALRQAAIVTSDESCGVKLSFAEGTFALATQAAEIGQALIELPIAHSGEPASITLDVGFCTEFCRTLAAEQQFTLDVADANAAALFTTDDGYVYVVMPLARK